MNYYVSISKQSTWVSDFLKVLTESPVRTFNKWSNNFMAIEMYLYSYYAKLRSLVLWWSICWGHNSSSKSILILMYLISTKFFIYRQKLFHEGKFNIIHFRGDFWDRLKIEKFILGLEGKPHKFRMWKKIFAALGWVSNTCSPFTVVIEKNFPFTCGAPLSVFFSWTTIRITSYLFCTQLI